MSVRRDTGTPSRAAMTSANDPGCVKTQRRSIAIEQVTRSRPFHVPTSQADSILKSKSRISFSSRFELLTFHTAWTQKRHHPDQARAAGRSAIPCYPTPIDFIEEARPFPRRVLRSPSGGPSTSSGPCAIFKRSGLAVECPRVAQMSGPAGVGRRIARYIVSGWALLWL
jgi:hypothetical protein